MPIATIQSQLQQLQNQLKLSQSPKQTKMLKSAIARLEEKLKEEVAEQARLKAEAEARAKAEKEAQAKKEREAQAKRAEIKAEVGQEPKAIANQASNQAESGKKKREPLPPKKQQTLKNGTLLMAVPGQGFHSFYWKIWAEIKTDDEGNYLLLPKGADQPIPIQLGRMAKRALEDTSLPVMRYCSLHPTIINGQIESGQLNACKATEERSEFFLAKAYWIAEEETLQIQTNFRYQKARSQNIFHQIPVKEGVTPPQTGFRSLQLERDRLNVFVTGEVDLEDAR